MEGDSDEAARHQVDNWHYCSLVLLQGCGLDRLRWAKQSVAQGPYTVRSLPPGLTKDSNRISLNMD